ncbi:MAG: EpsD family peptidyl-prolyl cis-trans isomerase [Rhodocyclaceae bacterium]|nr:MAG: EpsD family peptidyl-prolyl cis-trans isomerase [Rhodocyclaceae bacterium]
MNKLKTISAIVLSTLVLGACGDRPPEKKAASQVAAKVNDGEISVHQINFVLQRTPNIPAAKAEAAKRQVLESLIDQELAVQQAMEAKLERTPNVMQAIESARREILARAFIEQKVSKQAKPSADEVRKFYNDHPELFANRKIYRIEEVAFAATPEIIAGIKAQLGTGKASVAEVVGGLKAKGVEVTGGVSVKAAEQLALELLPRLAQAKDGQVQMIENQGRVAFITVLASKSEPMDEIKAQPFIENFINNKQKSEAARSTMKELREKAKIEYVGEFVAPAPAVAAAPAAAPAPAEAPQKAAANPTEAAVNKGIAGLK